MRINALHIWDLHPLDNQTIFPAGIYSCHAGHTHTVSNGKPGKGLAYTKEAQLLAQKAGYDNGIGYASQLIGRIYRKQNKLDDALVEYEKALAVYLRMGENRSATETYLSIGNIYFDKSDFQEAQHQYKTALKLAKDISNDPLRGLIYSALGITFQRLKKFEAAISYMDSARVVGKKINDQYTVLDSYEVLYQIHAVQHNYKESLTYFQQFTDLKDSLSEAESKSEMAELEMKCQNEKKTAEIELLKSDKALKETAIGRQRAIQIGITIALLSVIIISILLVNRYRITNRSKRFVEMERMRNTIARDLHDDIGSTLSSINIISQMALQDKNESASHFQHIAQHTSAMMESMSDIVWSINPNNDSLEQVISKMKEFASEILEPIDVSFSFSGEENLYTLSLDASLRKNVFLIFKEAINNAAKYSGATTISIDFQRKGNTLQLTIADNGKGFEPMNGSSGNGLRNMKERARTSNGALEVNSSPNNGTAVILSMPLT